MCSTLPGAACACGVGPPASSVAGSTGGHLAVSGAWGSSERSPRLLPAIYRFTIPISIGRGEAEFFGFLFLVAACADQVGFPRKLQSEEGRDIMSGYLSSLLYSYCQLYGTVGRRVGRGAVMRYRILYAYLRISRHPDCLRGRPPRSSIFLPSFPPPYVCTYLVLIILLIVVVRL